MDKEPEKNNNPENEDVSESQLNEEGTGASNPENASDEAETAQENLSKKINLNKLKTNQKIYIKSIIQNKKISKLPFWCNWSLMRLLFEQNKYKSSLKFFSVLFAKSSPKNLPKIIFFYIYVLLKIQFEKLK